MKRKSNSLFTTYLQQLGVRHTTWFSEKIYGEHPHKYNMLGLSQLLTEYKIENTALRFKEEGKAENLTLLEVPFIAYIGNDFGLVHRMTDTDIHYVWKGKRTTLPKKSFLNAWNGIVLAAEPDEYSTEPQYKEHLKSEFFHKVKYSLLICSIVLLCGLTIFSSHIYESYVSILSLLINVFGAWVSYLLVLKQMHVQSNYADKICSLFHHQQDCNNVLESNASKLWGIFSWSEIGLSYFISNIVMTIIFPELYGYVTLINICALPYTIWSVWYQKYMVKQWCPLCLLVQGILWLLFIHHIAWGVISFPKITPYALLFTGCIYAIPLLLLNRIIQQWTESRKVEQIRQEINSLKADEEVFKSSLRSSQKYDIDTSICAILWGNPVAANRITVVSNPHCNPCSKMHTRLTELLENTRNGFCIQYIFTSFNEELEESNKLIISMYQRLDAISFSVFLDHWFRTGKNNRYECYDKYPFDKEDREMLNEFQKQKEWINITKIRSTPTVLFNGYELPQRYKIEDLRYFVTIEIK